MVENRIESFAELEAALANLDNLSQELTSTLNEANAIYEDQKQGWYSAKSNSETQKMTNYAEEAQKIAKNIREVSETIQKFKTATRTTDEQ